MKRPLTVATATATLLLAGAGIAAASWDATVETGTLTAGRAADLIAPGVPSTTSTSTPTATSGVSLQWAAGSVAPAPATVRYHVQRVLNSATEWAGASDVCGSTDVSPILATSCTDSTVVAGETYRYRVTSAVGTSWREPGASSAAISVPPAGAVDISRPTVASVVRAEPTQQLTNAISVIWTVTFSEPVTGVDYNDFQLSGAGATNAALNGVTGGPTAYTVSASTGNDGILGLSVLNDGSIQDQATMPNALSGGTYTSGQTFTVDKTAPGTVALDDLAPNVNTNTLRIKGNVATRTDGNVTWVVCNVDAWPCASPLTSASETPNASNGNWDAGNVTMPANGTYYVRASQTDAAGNTTFSVVRTGAV